MRNKIIAGNWKMNKLPNEAIEFMMDLPKLIEKCNHEVIVCVPFIDLFYCVNASQDTKIKVGAQNMFWKESGAYTGEVSGEMLKSINVNYVIIGHSERRAYFNETDEDINKKVKAAIKNNITPIVCVGESLEQKEAGKTVEIITTQVEKALEGIEKEDAQKVIIAYEPIWAIGTGKTATAEDANNSIKQIRSKISKLYGEETAEKIHILYGGSVKSSNAKELFETSDIDGALIGGASLNAEEFAKIANYDK